MDYRNGARDREIISQLASRLKGKVILFLTALLRCLDIIRVRKSKRLLAAVKDVCMLKSRKHVLVIYIYRRIHSSFRLGESQINHRSGQKGPSLSHKIPSPNHRPSTYFDFIERCSWLQKALLKLRCENRPITIALATIIQIQSLAITLGLP